MNEMDFYFAGETKSEITLDEMLKNLQQYCAKHDGCMSCKIDSVCTALFGKNLKPKDTEILI